MYNLFKIKNTDHSKYFLTLIFASIMLFSSAIFLQNVFADQVVDTIQLPNLGNENSIGPPIVNPVTNMIYIGGWTANHEIYVVNGSSNLASYVQIESCSDPSNCNPPDYMISVNPNTNRIYVSGNSNGGLTVIDGSTNSIVTKILSSYDIRDIATNPVTNKIYAITDNFVTVIDGSTNSVIKEISLPDQQPDRIAVNLVTNKIYVAMDHSVGVIDGVTDTVVGTISTGQITEDVAVNPNTNRIYAFNSGGLAFSNPHTDVIDGETNSIIGTIPKFVITQSSINPNTNKFYLAYNNTSIAVIDGSTNSVVNYITVGSEPGIGGVNPATNKIYVVNQGDHTVSVIQGNKSVPQQPTGLTATAKLLKINLSWNTPSYNGGSVITGYMIERSTDNGNTWSTIVSNTGNTGTTYSDTNVQLLITYTYRVSAINDVGTSTPSNTASATTPSVGPITPPSLP